MIKNKKVLALIPARGGSKGIKNKNIRIVKGKPLIQYTIDESLKSKYIDYTLVSTDSKKIANIALKCGAKVPFIRPKYLAEDTSKTIDAVLYTIEELRKLNLHFDILVLLQPTQPLRTTEEIDNCIEFFINNNEQSVVSICKVEDHPILYRTKDSKNKLNQILNLNSTCRRQDLPIYYKVNGCIYINKINHINLNTSFNDNELGFEMPIKHSLDIDEIKDLKMFRNILNKE